MADLVLKRYDTWPPLAFALADVNGPIDLSTATQVLLLMKGQTVLIDGVCTITDAVLGEGIYEWVTGDTSVADTYSLEFQIDWSDGSIQTVPSDGYKTVLIEADLGP